MPDKHDASSVLFRVASAPRAGGGHVSRCLVVAEALRVRVPVLMVLDVGADAAMARCDAAGIPAVFGEPDDGAALWGACVLDGYDFSTAEFARYAALAPLIVMDDFGRPPPQAALAINSAMHINGDQLNGVPALLGPRYALIAPRFAARAPRPAPETVAHILVTFGRVDPDNATGLALRALALLRNQGMAPRITVVASGQQQASSLRDVFGDDATIVSDVGDMAPLLAEADLVIGAGGVSLFERMAAGVPSVSVLIAENQRLFLDGAVGEGATKFAGDATALTDGEMADSIAALCADRAARQRMSDRGRVLVDGRGAERVADALLRVCADRHQKATA